MEFFIGFLIVAPGLAAWVTCAKSHPIRDREFGRRAIGRSCCSLLLFLIFSLPAAAATAAGPAIHLNGSDLAADAAVREGSLYLPVRAVAESMGIDVSWTQETQTVTVLSDAGPLVISLPDMKITDGNHDTYLSAPSLTLNNRTFLPADFFSDWLLLGVRWEKEKYLVQLTSVQENDLTIRTERIDSETKALITTIQYPVISGLSNLQVEEGINARFRAAAEEAAAQGAKNAADLAPVLLEHPDMTGPSGQCVTYFNYQVKYNQKGLLSLVFQDYQFAGGAHGGTVQTGCTIDLKTGQLYALPNLFQADADYVTVLSDSVKKQLAERQLTDALFQPFSQIRADQDFYLSNSGLVVFFQQYEILPYAAGIQEFTVDYDRLPQLLLDRGLAPVNLQVGEAFRVILDGNPTTGYAWHYKLEGDPVLKLAAESSQAESDLLGAGSKFTWEFQAQQPGKGRLIFQYYRPWEGESSVLPENTVIYEINVDK